jgi:phasin family protein
MTSSPNPFGDITKIMQQFELPGVDMSKVVESYRKDIAALVESNKTAWAAMQAISAKQTEMLKETMKTIQEASVSAAKSAAANDVTKQGDIVRKACDKALADMKELADLAAKSQSDAMAHITQRASEHMQEIKTLMQGAGKK